MTTIVIRANTIDAHGKVYDLNHFLRKVSATLRAQPGGMIIATHDGEFFIELPSTSTVEIGAVRHMSQQLGFTVLREEQIKKQPALA